MFKYKYLHFIDVFSSYLNFSVKVLLVLEVWSILFILLLKLKTSFEMLQTARGIVKLYTLDQKVICVSILKLKPLDLPSFICFIFSPCNMCYTNKSSRVKAHTKPCLLTLRAIIRGCQNLNFIGLPNLASSKTF